MKRIIGYSIAVGVVLVAAGLLAFAWNSVAPRLNTASVAVTYNSKTAAAVAAENVQKESSQIQSILDTFSNKYPGQFAIVATDLDNGATAKVNDQQQMVSASLYKIFVAWGIYQKVDASTLAMASNVPALGESVGDCMSAMITVSDNDCGYALGEMVGWQTLDDQLAAHGFSHTMLNNYDAYGDLSGDKLTTAGDVAGFLTDLYQGKLLGQQSTTDFMNLLKNDQLNTWLPAGLPANVVIAHKTGALYNLVHDAGIVYTDKGDYLVVVMSQNWNDPVNDPPAAFADISSQLYGYFSS